MTALSAAQRWIAENGSTPHGRLFINWITNDLKRPLSSVTSVYVSHGKEYSTSNKFVMEVDFDDQRHAAYIVSRGCMPRWYIL